MIEFETKPRSLVVTPRSEKLQRAEEVLKRSGSNDEFVSSNELVCFAQSTEIELGLVLEGQTETCVVGILKLAPAPAKMIRDVS